MLLLPPSATICSFTIRKILTNRNYFNDFVGDTKRQSTTWRFQFAFAFSTIHLSNLFHFCYFLFVFCFFWFPSLFYVLCGSNQCNGIKTITHKMIVVHFSIIISRWRDGALTHCTQPKTQVMLKTENTLKFDIRSLLIVQF